jgi:hypothetical protein
MSAAAYTNRVRTRAQARVKKVEYEGGIATNYNPLAATINCDPSFAVLDYSYGLCLCNPPPLPCVGLACPGVNVYYGGNSVISYGVDIVAGNAYTPSANILYGGNSFQ